MRKRQLRRIGLCAAVAGIALISAACTDSPASPSTRGAVVLPRSATALPQFGPAQFKKLLATLKGRPVVVNFWASWCGPCKEEAPGLAREATALGERVQFIGVDILDKRSPARAFILAYGWPYPSVFDPTGAIRDDLGLIGQPNTVIYGASGKQSFVRTGAIPEEDLRKAIQDAFQA